MYSTERTMKPPRFGYLCLFENPTDEAGRALVRQFVLVREADRMRFDDIWIAEHHFDSAWPTGAAPALLGYLAGITAKARIGSAGLIPAFRDPVKLAEDAATLDLVTKGRFNFGIGHGGPFPEQHRQFGVRAAEAEERVLEAYELIGRLLYEEEVSFAGKYFKVDAMKLQPRPEQPIPTWIAAGSENMIRHAARTGAGIMCAATYTDEYLKRVIDIYRDEAPDGDPRLVLARFCFTAEKREDALAVAEPYLKAFSEHMRQTAIVDHPELSAALDPDALLKQSLVGNHEEAVERINRLNETIGVYSLALIPTTANFDIAKQCLANVVNEVRFRMTD